MQNSETMTNVKKTPLNHLHKEYQAKMAIFSGYEMPIQYPLGIKQEHIHTRTNAGLFDVSHMGQLLIQGQGAAQWLETLMPSNLVDLPIGKQRYTLLTNKSGGVIDDLIVSRLTENCFYLVINASRHMIDLKHLEAHLPTDDSTSIETLENRALIALQGPKAIDVLSQFSDEVNQMQFMDCKQITINDIHCFVSRSGYTGEDGFEISLPANQASDFCQALLTHSEVTFIGLGARDSLRLEAGLCLYGNELTETITPIEAGLIWAIGKSRRLNGSRVGGFLGESIILQQIANPLLVQKKRVGLISSSRAPIREGVELCNEQDEIVGKVTSGTYGASIEKAIAIGYINSQYVTSHHLFAKVRGKNIPIIISSIPFIIPNYYRTK